MKYKNFIYSLCAGAAALVACTDTWDQHYNTTGEAAGLTNQTLWEMICQDPSLEHYARVLKATHYDTQLDGSNMLSVWTVPISKEQADSIIAVYDSDKAAGLRDEDNSAIVRFVRNHICQYNRTVSSFTLNDTVKMLNGKYKYLSAGDISGHKFVVKNKLAVNGVMYRIAEPLPFFKNVYEELMDNPEVSAFADFIKEYNEYELDVAASVPGDIIDGKIHYLDSVTVLTNKFLETFKCHINREDSLYLLYVPTNDVWHAQYERYKQYFVYPTGTANRDSLQDAKAKYSVFMSRTFNINPYLNPECSKPEASRDSIMSTSYTALDWENNVFYKPYGENGIFANRRQVQCSNGILMIDDTDYSLDSRRTFLTDKTYNAWSLNWVYGTDDEKANYNDREKLNQNAAAFVVVDEKDSITHDDGTKTRLHMNRDQYILFSGSSPVLPQSTKFSFEIPINYSGAYYNMYFVFAPPIANDDSYKNIDTYDGNPLPTQFRAYKHDMLANGKLQAGKGTVAQIMNPEDGKRDFATIAGVVDTVCLLKAYQFNYTSSGGDVVCNICMESDVSGSDNGIKFTRNIRVNSVILRPFETKEAAEEDYENYVAARYMRSSKEQQARAKR